MALVVVVIDWPDGPDTAEPHDIARQIGQSMREAIALEAKYWDYGDELPAVHTAVLD
jgi:hypothetical protein